MLAHPVNRIQIGSFFLINAQVEILFQFYFKAILGIDPSKTGPFSVTSLPTLAEWLVQFSWLLKKGSLIFQFYFPLPCFQIGIF